MYSENKPNIQSLIFRKTLRKESWNKMTTFILTLKTQSKWRLQNITLSVDSISQSH